MVGPDNKPVAGEPVYVFARDSQNLTLTTDAKGAATFSFDTALWRDTVLLTVGRRSAPQRFRRIHPRRCPLVPPGEVQEGGAAGRALRPQPAAIRVPLGSPQRRRLLLQEPQLPEAGAGQRGAPLQPGSGCGGAVHRPGGGV